MNNFFLASHLSNNLVDEIRAMFSAITDIKMSIEDIENIDTLQSNLAIKYDTTQEKIQEAMTDIWNNEYR